jgi:hypothetical protein
MTSIKYCWRLFCFFPLVLFAQSDIDSLTEDNLARMKWSPELNETSCYYPHNSFSCILRNDSSILAMRQEDEYHSVEITVLDSNLTRKCSYNLNKKNKEFFKSRRVLGFAYQNQIPYLISINLGPTNELQAIPVSDNCSVDANSTIEISSGQFDKSSEPYLDFFKDVSKLKYTAFKQCTSQNGEYNFSNNPTFVTGSVGEFAQATFIGDPKVYVTTIGMYNDRQELLAVAKLSKPIQKSFSNEALIKVKLDF